VVQVLSAEDTGSVPFYGFEDLTMVPYCRKLIDTALLERWEFEAIDRYHQQVFKALRQSVPDATRSWLERETAPLS